MASPVGHAMIGLALGGVAAAATNTESSVALWLGCFVASGVPDLDFAAAAFGRSGPAYHRNASHSILALAAMSALLWPLAGWLAPDAAFGTWLAWSVALWSHAAVDVLTAGPEAAVRGYGIALGWPLSRRRVSLQRPLLETADFTQCRTVGDWWVAIRPEIVRLGPIALGLAVLAMVL